MSTRRPRPTKPKIAQWLLDKGYATERDLVTIFDEQGAVHGDSHGMPFNAVVGTPCSARGVSIAH
jgi:hypothetical protein